MRAPQVALGNEPQKISLRLKRAAVADGLPAEPVGRVDHAAAAAVLDQGADDLEVAVGGRVVQRRVSQHVGHLWVCAHIQQYLFQH